MAGMTVAQAIERLNQFEPSWPLYEETAEYEVTGFSADRAVELDGTEFDFVIVEFSV